MSDATVATPQPAATARSVDTRWELCERNATGTFVASTRGTLLFRIDRERGVIYAWDRKGGCEVAVLMRELLPAQLGV